MENPQVERKTKSSIKSIAYATLRVKRTTRKRVMEEVTKANRKDWGKRVKVDEIILLAINRVTATDIDSLQEASLSHADRLERDYRQYLTKHDSISKDEYLGKRLDGEIPSGSGSAAEEGFKSVEKSEG